MAGIWDTLIKPSANPDDWYAEATNQAGHSAIIGMPLAVLVLALGVYPVAVPVIVAAIYGIIWEAIAQHGADWRDSLMDTAHVMSGASIIVGALVFGFWTCLAALVIWLCLIVLGVWMRL